MRGPVVVAVALLLGSSTAVIAAPASSAVTVYLDRDGHVDADKAVTIPAYRGNAKQWAATTACVRQHFAPFQINVVEARPSGFDYVTVVVGGKASAVGLDDGTTNGVGPYNGSVIRNATVFVFSEIGTAEKDIENVCAVIAHEVGHALGLEHTYYCGDVMSYFLDKCGARKFLDVNQACGEYAKRDCATGASGQNSYRRLVALVGLRGGPAAEPTSDDSDDSDSDITDTDGDDPDADTADAPDTDADPADSNTDDADDTAAEPSDPYVDPWGSNDPPAKPSTTPSYTDDSEDTSDAKPATPSCGSPGQHRGHANHAPAAAQATQSTQVRFVRRGNAVYKITTTYTR